MISKEENLLNSAEILFAEKGFSGTSTREIAKKANANISMISYYFGSKEKLYEKIFEFRINESFTFSRDVLANADINEWEKMGIVIDRYADRVRRLKPFYQILQREQLTNRNPVIFNFLMKTKLGFLEIYSELIEKGRERKIFTKNPRLEFIHATIPGTIFNALNTLPAYQEFFGGDENYEIQYFDELKIHIKTILKHLLGYDENK